MFQTNRVFSRGLESDFAPHPLFGDAPKFTIGKPRRRGKLFYGKSLDKFIVESFQVVVVYEGPFFSWHDLYYRICDNYCGFFRPLECVAEDWSPIFVFSLRNLFRTLFLMTRRSSPSGSRIGRGEVVLWEES